MGKMKINEYGMSSIAFLLAALVCAVLCAPGCGGGTVSRETVEEIDTVFREGNSQLVAVTAFLAALDDFSFENAAFYEDTMQAIEESREAASGLRRSAEELASIDYRGNLDEVGKYTMEYCDAVLLAVDELEAVCDSLQDILEAIEPILREEAVITQLEAPRSNEEWLQRLYRLEAAAGPSAAELAEVEVPPALAEYKALMDDLFSTLHKMTSEIIAVSSGQVANVEMEHNPDFLHMQELQESYPPLVEELYERLLISAIDPLLEKVELEINRLYLEESE